MTYTLTVPSAASPRPPHLPLEELLALLTGGSAERHQRMTAAAERLLPLEYQPPLQRQSRFRPVFAAV